MVTVYSCRLPVITTTSIRPKAMPSAMQVSKATIGRVRSIRAATNTLTACTSIPTGVSARAAAAATSAKAFAPSVYRSKFQRVPFQVHASFWQSSRVNLSNFSAELAQLLQRSLISSLEHKFSQCCLTVILVIKNNVFSCVDDFSVKYT